MAFATSGGSSCKKRKFAPGDDLTDLVTDGGYETGTYVPEMDSSGSAFSLESTSTGLWTKVGRTVSFQLYIDVDNTAGTSGNVTISLPPFPAASAANGGPAFSSINIAFASVALGTGYGSLVGRVSPGASEMLMIQVAGDGTSRGFITLPSTGIGAATFFYINGTYITDP